MPDIAPLIIPTKPVPQAPAQSPSTSGNPGSDNPFSAELNRAAAANNRSAGNDPSQNSNSTQKSGTEAASQPADTAEHTEIPTIQPDGAQKKSAGSAIVNSGDESQLHHLPDPVEFTEGSSLTQSTTVFQLALDPQTIRDFESQFGQQDKHQSHLDTLASPAENSAQTDKTAFASANANAPIQVQLFSANKSFTLTASGGNGTNQSAFTAQYSLAGNFATTTVTPETQAAESLLTARLQKLVQNNETGVISITKQSTGSTQPADLNGLTRSPLLATPAETTPGVTSPTTPVIEEPSQLTASFSQLTNLKPMAGESNEKPVPNKLGPLRQDAQGQYFEAKIAEQAKRNSGAMDQQMDQQETMARQEAMAQNKPFSNTHSLNGSDQGGSFTQVLHTVQPQNSLQQQNVAMPQPTTAPPGAMVNEDSILNQVTERFQFTTRNLETQLQIKLQPAELGELKIDLSMKDGAIKAHVIAQSGQVQEVLEKNMAKLKEVLEGQGFTIEDIVVSQKQETTGGFDLMQDHLAQGESQQTDTNPSMSSNFSETFDEIVTESLGSETGVNLTV